MKPLILIPTYNERDNVERLFQSIEALGIPFDYLFVDDSSPDGTGRVLEEIAKTHPQVKVLHRKGKLGIGSAHRDGIRWAYEHRYPTLITMDADFTHTPQLIPQMLEAGKQYDVVLTTRYASRESLKGWNMYRKTLTRLGHLLTRVFLHIPYDATGAFRLYRLDKISSRFLDEVESQGYSFFFESLYRLHHRSHSIVEIPISLFPRTYGSSKMTTREVLNSVGLLFRLGIRDRFPLSR